MAASLLRRHSTVAVLFFLLLFVILLNKSAVVDSRTCERRSKTWSGFCGSSNNCNRQCRNWEHALHGACHAQFPGFACFCYFNC
ncbi:defensin-like protein 19 [Primulina tabacum]|uniref:defensin-like protein 19 n=1 Tax=Primulina tabacum TaxID=48773 RepID=UPI003F5937A5